METNEYKRAEFNLIGYKFIPYLEEMYSREYNSQNHAWAFQKALLEGRIKDAEAIDKEVRYYV